MPGKVIILGAKGRFGRAAMDAFQAAGWQVTAFARARFDALSDGINFIQGDASDAVALSQAAIGHDVIVNALNPPYGKWAKLVPVLTQNVIAVAKASGATVMLPGNVYNYGATMPQQLAEDTLHAPSNHLGKLRVELEEAYAIAADDGVRTVILRGGDFIERAQTGNWFDTHMTPKIAKGRVTYPGPRDLIHAWAYLPDMARALVALAEKRSEFAMFETFGYPGYALTGDELVASLSRVTGRDLKVGKMPWGMLKMIGAFAPDVKGVVAMSYLWRTPHAIDGSKLQAALPNFQATDLDRALKDAVSDRL